MNPSSTITRSIASRMFPKNQCLTLKKWPAHVNLQEIALFLVSSWSYLGETPHLATSPHSTNGAMAPGTCRMRKPSSVPPNLDHLGGSCKLSHHPILDRYTVIYCRSLQIDKDREKPSILCSNIYTMHHLCPPCRYLQALSSSIYYIYNYIYIYSSTLSYTSISKTPFSSITKIMIYSKPWYVYLTS